MDTKKKSWKDECKCNIKRACISGLFGGVVLGLFIFYGVEYHVFRRKEFSGTTQIQQAVKLEPVSRKLPAAIIIGVKKGGTRALLNMLKLHPDIETASGEVHFFDRNATYRKGLEWYKNRMPLTGKGKITVEKTPAYFHTPAVPQRVSQFNRNIKLILIVRDPLIRSISDYTQLNVKRQGQRTVKSFEEAIFDTNGNIKDKVGIVRISLYDLHYKRWLQYFNREQIHIVDGDTFISNPCSELKKVERFLEVRPYYRDSMFVYSKEKGFFCWRKMRKTPKTTAVPRDSIAAAATVCLGPGKGRKHPDIAEELTSKLRAFYKPHMEQFYQACGRNFNWY